MEANETEVSDISCLSGMPELSGLEVIRTNVTDYSISPIIPEEENFCLHISYREDMDLEVLAAMKEQDILTSIYDVPENMLKMVRSYGATYTVSATDLYLHPVEEITEAVEEVTEAVDDTETSEMEASVNG